MLTTGSVDYHVSVGFLERDTDVQMFFCSVLFCFWVHPHPTFISLLYFNILFKLKLEKFKHLAQEVNKPKISMTHSWLLLDLDICLGSWMCHFSPSVKEHRQWVCTKLHSGRWTWRWIHHSVSKEPFPWTEGTVTCVNYTVNQNQLFSSCLLTLNWWLCESTAFTDRKWNQQNWINKGRGDH